LIYLDASAIVKLLVAEKESLPLQSHLESATARLVTSDISRVEVARAVRQSKEPLHELSDVLAPFEFISINEEVLQLAALVQPWTLRALDAIHVASATVVRADLQEFIAYDRVLVSAMKELGFRVSSPN
jgi:predicted nucleic acid-binding protein